MIRLTDDFKRAILKGALGETVTLTDALGNVVLEGVILATDEKGLSVATKNKSGDEVIVRVDVTFGWP